MYSRNLAFTLLPCLYLRVELVTIGVPDALQLVIAAAADVICFVVVGLHQVEEKPRPETDDEDGMAKTRDGPPEPSSNL